MSSSNSDYTDYPYLNAHEKEAALKAAFDAGEYIESLGKTDLSEFTKHEFETLILVICNSAWKNAIPF